MKTITSMLSKYNAEIVIIAVIALILSLKWFITVNETAASIFGILMGNWWIFALMLLFYLSKTYTKRKHDIRLKRALDKSKKKDVE